VEFLRSDGSHAVASESNRLEYRWIRQHFKEEMAPDQNVVESTPSRPGYVFVIPWELHCPGGVNQVVTNLYNEMLLGGDMEPLIMVTTWSAFRPVEAVIDARDTVHLRLWSPGERRPIVGLLTWLLTSPVWVFDLLRFCRIHRVAAFNFHFPSLSVFPIAVLRSLGLYRGALIISFHGSDLRNARGKGRIHDALWRFVLRSASAIVACSKALAADVREFATDWISTVS
jgi:hypothetical protein